MFHIVAILIAPLDLLYEAMLVLYHFFHMLGKVRKLAEVIEMRKIVDVTIGWSRISCMFGGMHPCN